MQICVQQHGEDAASVMMLTPLPEPKSKGPRRGPLPGLLVNLTSASSDRRDQPFLHVPSSS